MPGKPKRQDRYRIVEATKVWAWPTKNITQKPASLLSHNDVAVLASPKGLQINPKRFQQVATEF